MKCPYRFGFAGHEGGEECIGEECAVHLKCIGDTPSFQERKEYYQRKCRELEAANAEMQVTLDELADKCAELCLLCGFSMVDANGEVI